MPTQDKSRSFRFLFGFFIVLFIAEALATTILIPSFATLLDGFGANIPTLTKLLLHSPKYIWLLPLVAIYIYIHSSKTDTTHFNWLFVLLVIGLAWVPLTIYGLYLPIIELGNSTK